MEGGERGSGREARARGGLECGQAPQEAAPLGAAGTLRYCLRRLEPRTAVAGKLATSICSLATGETCPAFEGDRQGWGRKQVAHVH